MQMGASAIDALRRPVPLPALVAAVAAAAVAVALYCVAYTSLSGQSETLIESLGWAVANVCPWLVAIEAGKRAPSWIAALAILVAAGAASLLLGIALGMAEPSLAFDALRRLPPFIAVAALVAVLRSGAGSRTAAGADIPLLPRQIDWVRAAGNYVEIRSGGRTIVHRAPISSAERALATHGFVRIHRSTLVRRDRIARVRSEDVVLRDGTHLKIGKRYRAELSG